MTGTEDKLVSVRRQNDAFRRTFVGGRIVLSREILGLDIELRREIIRAVHTYDEWEPGNDKHDFGAVQVQGLKVFWEIKCFDLQLASASPDASDVAVTRRVLTIMREEH